MKKVNLRVLLLLWACLSTAWAQRDPSMTPEKALIQLPDGYRHEQVMMPMRDGVKLVTEIFIPPGEGPFPTMLLRTPYTRWDLRPMGAMGWQENDGRYADGNRYDRQRIDHCALDLALQGQRFLHVRRKPVQDGVENTADFSGFDHAQKQFVE